MPTPSINLNSAYLSSFSSSIVAAKENPLPHGQQTPFPVLLYPTLSSLLYLFLSVRTVCSSNALGTRFNEQKRMSVNLKKS
jgi:hypothetical protein